MAKYFTNFKHAHPKSALPGEWTMEWGSAEAIVTAGNPENDTDRSIEYEPPPVNHTREAIAWSSKGVSRETEVSVRFTSFFGATQYNAICGPTICGRGTQETRTGYSVWISGSLLRIAKHVNGTDTTVASISAETLFPTQNQKYDVRCDFSVDNSGQVKAWIWLASTVKPTDPTLSYNDSASFLQPGWAGFTNVSISGLIENIDILFFGIGTNGDPAPTGPVDEYRFLYDPYLFSAAELTGIPTLTFPGVTDITATSARPQVTLTY